MIGCTVKGTCDLQPVDESQEEFALAIVELDTRGWYPLEPAYVMYPGYWVSGSVRPSPTPSTRRFKGIPVIVLAAMAWF